MSENTEPPLENTETPFERIGKIDRFAESGERSTEGLPITKGFPQRQKPKRVWFNALLFNITDKINQLIDAVNRLGNADNPIYQMYDVGDVFVTTNHYDSPEAVTQAKGYGTWRRYSQGRALVGYTEELDAPVDYAVMGNEFGENEVTLEKDQMPKHKHSTPPFSKFGSRSQESGFETQGSGDYDKMHEEYGTGDMTETAWAQAEETEQGGDQPHNNVPPSTVVAFWLRVA